MRLSDDAMRRLKDMPGDVSLYARNFVTGEQLRVHADRPLIAASVIKLALLGEVYRRFDAGEMDPDRLVELRREHKAPGCGALALMHDGLRVTLRDLCVLMVVLSDNTATNMLFDMTGSAAINAFLESRGLDGMDFNRKMFDEEASARGVQNHITAASVGQLLEKMYFGRLVSPEADREMLEILKNQKLNHKIPFFLHGCEIAHKTGEDDGVSHDAAIVYARQPFALCLFSNRTDVPAFERLMQDIAAELAAECGGFDAD